MLEQPSYNLLRHLFVRLSPDDMKSHTTMFTQNRDCLFNEQVTGRFLKILMAASELK